MPDKKKTAPLATNGTVTTSDACNNHCDYYDITASVHNQEVFGNFYYSCQLGEVEDMCLEQSITYDTLLCRVTGAYLGTEIDLDMPPTADAIKAELVNITNRCIDKYNLGKEDENAPANAKMRDRFPDMKEGNDKFPKLRSLTPVQVAMCVHALHHAVALQWDDANDDGNFDIALYQTEGSKKGVYDANEAYLTRVIRQYESTLSKNSVEDVKHILGSICPEVSPCDSPHLIAVNNGIFDYKNKVLMPFDPAYVFTSKSAVDYVEGAPNPIIHNAADGTDWDVASWMGDLSDDPEVVQLLWEMLGAAIRPGVSWNKSAWLYSETGNNGKGTYCTLMRNLCGKGAWASVPLKAFGEQFMLEPLMRVSAVITDENDTSTYLDDAAALKSIITGDPFLLNRKFKEPRTVRFRGFMTQCVNAYPRLRDRSESMYRRLLVVPFDKRFEGHERKYIKNDYLHRKEVLEYVLFHVLREMDYYELSVPEACVDALNEYRMVNDPVRDFCEDVLPQAAWDLLPWTFLHDLYKCWMVRRQPQSRAESLRAFKSRVLSILDDYPEWSDSVGKVRTCNRMDAPEPLILEYDVTEWMNKDYHGQDRTKLCTVDPKVNYRGLVRDPSVAAALAADAASGIGVMPDDGE